MGGKGWRRGWSLSKIPRVNHWEWGRKSIKNKKIKLSSRGRTRWGHTAWKEKAPVGSVLWFIWATISSSRVEASKAKSLLRAGNWQGIWGRNPQGYTRWSKRASGGANKGGVGELEGGEWRSRELSDTKLGKGKDHVCVTWHQLHNAVLSMFTFQLCQIPGMWKWMSCLCPQRFTV